MSNLESLVPPLELCKLIPAGEFGDSALVWLNINYVTIPWKVVARNISNYKMERNKKKIPAPTLQEIMEKLEQFSVSCLGKGYQTEAANGWNAVSDDTATTAALKLWLKLKGVEA
jgi:hypothetical protein